MNKTCLALALLITGFLLAGDAYGGDVVYHCTETASNGFEFDDKSLLYKSHEFKTKSYKMKFNWVTKTIELGYGNYFHCRVPYEPYPDFMSCLGVNVPYLFNFNKHDGRFVKSQAFGHALNFSDPIITSYGKCDKF